MKLSNRTSSRVKRGGAAILLGGGILLTAFFGFPVSSEDGPSFSPHPGPAVMTVQDEEEGEKVANKKNKIAYIGTKGCKKCHMKQTGDQYNTWKKGPHAKAYETLKTDAAKALAKKLGLGEDPTKETDCLRCHVTGHGEPAELTKKIVAEDGVSCESCHGPGDKYNDKTIHFDRKLALKNGYVEATEKVCIQCHNNTAPEFKGFDFHDRVKKINHSIPDDKRQNKVKKD